MVDELLLFVSALWLGILTSISPCPLAANIAAVSFLSKKAGHPKAVLGAGAAYTLGRMATYMILGVVVIGSLVSIPAAAHFLQKYMNKALGPILVAVGLLLLDVVKIKLPRFVLSHQRQGELAGAGLGGSFALGALFALSFCPVAAALFFGSLIPLALSSDHGIMFPLVYGVGTGLPVVAFAIALSLGVGTLSTWLHKTKRLEKVARKATGVLFVLSGLYYLCVYVIF